MKDKTLAQYPSRRLESFLIELANLPSSHARQVLFIKKYGHMLSDLPDAEQWRHPAIAGSREQLEIKRAVYVQRELQVIWRSGKRESKQCGTLKWMVALPFVKWVQKERPSFMLDAHIMRPGPFAQALLHLVNSDRALVCRNPECRIQQYFFRPPDKKRQVYCSEVCAEVAQRQWKKIWWDEHGDKWRKRRRAREKNTQPTKTKGKTDGTRKTR